MNKMTILKLYQPILTDTILISPSRINRERTTPRALSRVGAKIWPACLRLHVDKMHDIATLISH